MLRDFQSMHLYVASQLFFGSAIGKLCIAIGLCAKNMQLKRLSKIIEPFCQGFRKSCIPERACAQIGRVVVAQVDQTFQSDQRIRVMSSLQK